MTLVQEMANRPDRHGGEAEDDDRPGAGRIMRLLASAPGISTRVACYTCFCCVVFLVMYCFKKSRTLSTVKFIPDSRLEEKHQ